MSTRLLARSAALAGAAFVGALLVTPSAAADDRGAYIVVLEDGAGRGSAVAAEHRRDHGAQVGFVYERALQGYSATLTRGALAAVRRDRRVAYVERDGVVTTTTTQTGATWGLDRVDQRDLPLSTTFTATATGAGVTAWIVDTGIRSTHKDFGGRVAKGSGFTAFRDRHGTEDCNGHGTHVAGTVGGATWGVAKSVTLVPVRVLDCRGSGTWSGVIAGVDHVTAGARSTPGPDVANMSLGGGAVQSLDDAVRASIASGVTYAVAAGNDGRDASAYSPARVEEALTVGATDKADARASFSNFGPVLDLFAPGVSITSAWHKNDTATNTISGTSMASPHVAGVVALHLQGNPTALPADVATAITSLATPHKVTGAGTGSPNRLLFTDY